MNNLNKSLTYWTLMSTVSTIVLSYKKSMSISELGEH